MPTRIRMVPAHEVVRRTFPRPPPEEKDLVAIAVGRAVDSTLAEYGHAYRLGRRPTVTAMRAHARGVLDEALAEAAVDLPSEERDRRVGQVAAVLNAYRKSPILGLSRPKSHVMVIDGVVGVYAQPDFWDGHARFFEMKSYRAVPPPPDVALQIRLFQLAFPKFEAVLVCFNRHVDPVETVVATIPPPTVEEGRDALERAYAIGQEFGVEKVLEYVEGPRVHYTRTPGPG